MHIRPANLSFFSSFWDPAPGHDGQRHSRHLSGYRWSWEWKKIGLTRTCSSIVIESLETASSSPCAMAGMAWKPHLGPCPQNFGSRPFAKSDHSSNRSWVRLSRNRLSNQSVVVELGLARKFPLKHELFWNNISKSVKGTWRNHGRR